MWSATSLTSKVLIDGHTLSSSCRLAGLQSKEKQLLVELQKFLTYETLRTDEPVTNSDCSSKPTDAVYSWSHKQSIAAVVLQQQCELETYQSSNLLSWSMQTGLASLDELQPHHATGANDHS